MFVVPKLNEHECGMDICIPTNIQQMKKFMTEDEHSILKNFPVQEVFEIKGHVLMCITD